MYGTSVNLSEHTELPLLDTVESWHSHRPPFFFRGDSMIELSWMITFHRLSVIIDFETNAETRHSCVRDVDVYQVLCKELRLSSCCTSSG